MARTRSAVESGTAVGDIRVALAHDAAHDAWCAAWRVDMAEVRPMPPREPGSEAWSHGASLIGAHAMPDMQSRMR